MNRPKGIYKNILCCADTICAVCTLIFNSWIPPAVQMNDVIRCHDIQSYARCARGEDKYSKALQTRKPVHDFLTLPRNGVTSYILRSRAPKLVFDKAGQNTLRSSIVDENDGFLVSCRDVLQLFERLAQSRRH